jgi:hypothetical protein
VVELVKFIGKYALLEINDQHSDIVELIQWLV